MNRLNTVPRANAVQFAERGCTSGKTKGRCWKCNVVWWWKAGVLRMRDARCPTCGGVLRATAYYTKSVPWKELKVRK